VRCDEPGVVHLAPTQRVRNHRGSAQFHLSLKHNKSTGARIGTKYQKSPAEELCNIYKGETDHAGAPTLRWGREMVHL
jgi:hypothetical protein